MSEIDEPVICTACSEGPCAKTYLGSKGCEAKRAALNISAVPAAPPAPEE